MERTRELPREEWQSYFDRLVTEQTLRASVEIGGPELGDQIEAEQLPLASISHDDHSGRVTIGVGGAERYPVVLWHTIERPPHQHASAHARGTGHPIARSAEPGESWSWCYVDNIAFVATGS